MLRLFFYFHGKLLKVRPLRNHEEFTHPITWKNKIQFEVTTNPDFMMIWTSVLPDLTPEYAQALLSLVGARYPFSFDHDELKSICPEIVFRPDKEDEEWIFFGGSFNPWHQGHQACLDLIDHSKICFVAPDRNPFKEVQDSDVVVTILELSSKVKFRKNQFFVPTFLLSKEKNPTINWVEKLLSKNTNIKISLLLGFDSFKSITTWTRSNDLLQKIFKIYVAPRLESEKDRIIYLDKVKYINSELQVEFLSHHPFEGLSSTSLRNNRK